MPETKVSGRRILFCPKCDWCKVEDEPINDFREPIECPKCHSWLWEVYAFNYYQNGKLIAREHGITDNDECSLHGDSLYELKRIFDKGFALIEPYLQK